MHRDAPYLVAHQLAFARVQPSTNLQPQGAHALGNCACAANSARRAVEGREETVAGAIDLAPAKVGQLAANERMVTVEQIVPNLITEAGSALSGTDDVGEKDCRKYAVGFEAVARACQELFDLVGDDVPVSAPRNMIDALELYQSRTADALGH